jgi:hypothetical protein
VNAHNAHLRIVVAAVVGTLAFWAYTRTLLPGVDLGDTGGFQAAVLWPEVTARQAYPLYYGLAKPFVAAASAANPARGLNLFSAIWAAAAVAMIVEICGSVTGSLPAGAVAGLLLAFSYTFWTQAVIAEVYSLHLALIAICLLALRAYAVRPTTTRLALFFAVYALSFGNHLSMILLFVPFGLFLLTTTPAPGALVRPRVVALAFVMVIAGLAEYWPNFTSVSDSIYAPRGLSDRLAAFWFDTTKADWRELMVLAFPASQALDRLAMWWFDLRQQFGIAGIVLAAAGVLHLWKTARPWGVLLVVAYAISTVFALTYNVGDTHVFFLPGHFMTALCAGAGILLFPSRRFRIAVAVGALAYGGWRGWTTWPVVDRHDDRRGEQLIAGLTRGLSDRNAVLVEQLDWQLENVLLYMGRYERRDLAWTRLGDVLPHFPFLVEDNHAIGRDIVLSAGAAADVVSAYGARFPLVEESDSPGLADVARRIPAGAPYVFSLLTPPSAESLDPDLVTSMLQTLTGNHTPARTESAYEVVAGLAGDRPAFYRAANRPFEERFALAGDPFLVRMDSWLATDTFRRAGFGHVLRQRERVLILERGANLVWFDRDGVSSAPQYAGSTYAVKPRFRIPAAAPQLAGGAFPVGVKLVRSSLPE